MIQNSENSFDYWIKQGKNNFFIHLALKAEYKQSSPKPWKVEPHESAYSTSLAMLDSRMICNLCSAQVQRIFASISLCSICK